MQYVSTAGEGDACVFCDLLRAGADEDVHILYRGEQIFVVLNAFPYNTGHLMVAPLRHVGELHDLEPGERAELMEVSSAAVDHIAEAMAPHGFNLGMNLGGVAGAGIPGHLHMHVVPRWGGDTNYMTVVGETKVLPELLDDTYRKLRPLFLHGSSGR
jgi:ATP adenylyltransferase